jgi:hypothetical protein
MDTGAGECQHLLLQKCLVGDLTIYSCTSCSMNFNIPEELVITVIPQNSIN